MKPVKTIGLVGGMSWESSLHYYRLINEGVRARCGGLHSAKLVLHSVDFAPIARMQTEDRWEEASAELVAAASSVQSAGADFLLLCTNTMHRVAPDIERALRIPLVHIVDTTARAITQRSLGPRVGLLGTRFTMEQPFYRERLEQHGLEVITPGADARATIHRVIYEELCVGRIEPSSRDEFRRIATELEKAGARALILGCTEIMMLLSADDVSVPVFDTTAVHAAAAVDFAVG